MPGFTDERGLAHLFGDGPHPPGDALRAARFADDGRSRPVAAGVRKLSVARGLLDGIGGLGWSVIGFVGGAIFWHFIGFWGFVADVVLAGGPSPATEQAAIHASMTDGRAPQVQVADASVLSCTLLSRDRTTGVTSARPCDSSHAPLPADSFQGRQDRIAGTEKS